VEAAETAIPRTILGSGLNENASNIKIRLRGSGEAEHILKHDGSNGNIQASGYTFFGRNTSRTSYGTATGKVGGLISVMGKTSNNGETVADLTLQLEKGITLKGRVDSNPSISTSTNNTFHYKNLVSLNGNAALVMKSGSKLTGHYMSGNTGSGVGKVSVIYRTNAMSTPASSALQAVSIEAGAQITGNKIKTFENPPNDINKMYFIYFEPVGKVFISKGAIIQDNVQSGNDNVNFICIGTDIYDIKSDGTGTTDHTYPLGE
jgi:hypothetical protein